MTSGRPDGDELLGSPRPLLPPRVRLAAIVLVALAVAAGIAVAAWPDGQHARPTAASTSRPVRTTTSNPPSSTATTPHRMWPTAPEACGGDAELPLVTGAVPPAGHTGISVALAGTRLAELDFDSGRVSRPARAVLLPHEYAVGLLGGRTLLLETFNCRGADFGPPRLLRLTTLGPVGVRIPHRIDFFLVDGSRVWGLRWPRDRLGHGVIYPAGGGAPVRLPRGFVPAAVTDGVLIGSVARSSNNGGVLVLVDAATGEVRRNLGVGQSLAAADGIVVWTTGCDLERPAACAAHRQSVDGGPVTGYRLPRPPAGDAVLSPDHRLLAFAMERSAQDPRYVYAHPFPPADIAVLNLDTGLVETVPGIEIPAKSAPALEFTDDNWLVIGLGAGTRTRVLAWRHGLPHPMETRAVPGLVGSPPAMAVLHRSAGTITHRRADR